MAGDWIKMECCTPEKSEVLAVTANLGWDDPDLTVGKLFRLWRWFDQHTSDGNATGVTFALLDRIVGVTGFCDSLTQVGWLVQTERGICLPNFERHNGNTAKHRALTAKRVANHKANAKGNALGNGEGNAHIVTSALPREEKRREEKKVIQIPAWMPLECWDAYMEVRKGIKCANTPKAIQMLVNKLDELRRQGHDPVAVLEQSTVNSWKTLYPLKEQPAKPKHVDYCEQHKGADWWRNAGFESVWEAVNSRCNHKNAHEFRNGQRVQEAA